MELFGQLVSEVGYQLILGAVYYSYLELSRQLIAVWCFLLNGIV